MGNKLIADNRGTQKEPDHYERDEWWGKTGISIRKIINF
jgi:hypothetical protein